MCNSQFSILSPKAQRPSVLNSQLSIRLPLSKSVRARELVLDALNGRAIEIEEENDDLFVLSRALKQCTMHNAQLSNQSDLSDVSDVSDDSNQSDDSDQSDVLDNSQLSTFNFQLSTLNLNASGTALRFMTAYCSVTEGEWELMGSERLCERPIKPLVDALRGMGADIEYVNKEGFAPLKINGRRLRGGKVRLDASLSSQFASALMLIADRVDGGIEIEYEGDVASQSYIRLTQKVIERYKSGVMYSDERDWSSATVWYATMAVLKKGKFLFDGLRLDSFQPDRAIVEVFEKLGVRTMEVENGVEIKAGGEVVERLVLDCKNMPDAVMYIAVAACLLGVKFEISGVETLRVKESDRIETLINEMKKCSYVLKYDEMGRICWFGERCEKEGKPKIVTYNDHRVAMAMAVVGLTREIDIENLEVVNKSYPGFWEELNGVRYFIDSYRIL